MTEEEVDYLVDGADIDGDGDINYVAYSHLVCRKILKLDSRPLRVGFKKSLLKNFLNGMSAYALHFWCGHLI